MDSIKAGLLPMYVKLYDDCAAYLRPRMEEFYETIAKKFEKEGLTVLRAPVCRLESEYENELEKFRKEGAEAVIALHLSYAPSLESHKPLVSCGLPIFVLNTTQDYEFTPFSTIDDINYNHGIQGVQDTCSLLVRDGVKFKCFTGHWRYSDVCKRTADSVKATHAAYSLKSSVVGVIGEPFTGMGDFRVPYDKLRDEIGIAVNKFPASVIGEYAERVSGERVLESWGLDSERYLNNRLSKEHYLKVERVSLAVRDWIEAEKLSAFSINFLEAGKTTGLRYMPFDAACKAMADGIGYAGEGDAFTAAFVGALLSSWGRTTFAEMFCPSWNENTIFISHMGEFNLRIADSKPVMSVKPFNYTDAGDSFLINAPMSPGKAVYLDLTPGTNGAYTLIAADITMLKPPEKHNFIDFVCGWFRPGCPVSDFLEAFSLAGGTHHGAVVYDTDASSFKAMADVFGWSFVKI